MNNKNSIIQYFLKFCLIPIFIISIFVTGCVNDDNQKSSQSNKESKGVPVSTTTIESKTLEETLTAIGSLEANQSVDISPEISGKIEKILFQEGDTVQKGDTLVEIDDDKLRDRYQARQHSLEEAQAQLMNARRTFERNKRLHKKDMISSQEKDNSEEAFLSAKARVSRIESEVQEAGEQLEDATLKAPFSGYIGEKRIDAGNFIQPGSVITRLMRINPIEVRFTVSERFAGRIREGQNVRAQITAYPDTYFPGKITYVSPSIRQQTRDLVVKAKLPNRRRLLKPGNFAQVEIVVETLSKRPVVPAKSLISTRDGYFVFTVQNSKAQRQGVKIGLRQPGIVEIREGLSPGDVIVRSGHMSVSDGARVKSLEDKQSQ